MMWVLCQRSQCQPATRRSEKLEASQVPVRWRPGAAELLGGLLMDMPRSQPPLGPLSLAADVDHDFSFKGPSDFITCS